MSYTYDSEGPVGGRIIEARVGGAEIRPERYYRVALPSFILSGGDGFTMFEKTLILNGSATAPEDVVVLADYCRKLGRVDSRIEGRITVLSSSADTRKTGNWGELLGRFVVRNSKKIESQSLNYRRKEN